MACGRAAGRSSRPRASPRTSRACNTPASPRSISTTREPALDRGRRRRRSRDDRRHARRALQQRRLRPAGRAGGCPDRRAARPVRGELLRLARSDPPRHPGHAQAGARTDRHVLVGARPDHHGLSRPLCRVEVRARSLFGHAPDRARTAPDIHVSVIEPGPIRTSFTANALTHARKNIDIEHSVHRGGLSPPHPLHGEGREHFWRARAGSGAAGLGEGLRKQQPAPAIFRHRADATA